MKFLCKILLLCLSVFMFSCTNEEPVYYDTTESVVMLTRSSDVFVYSGDTPMPNFEKWQSDRGWSNVPNDPVSKDEIDYVINYIKTHPDEGKDVCDLTNYYIQNVGSSKDTYHLSFMNGDQIHHTTDITGGNQMDYLVIDGYHINDYNATGGSLGLATNMPLTNITYHDSYANLTIENAYKFYYIEYNGKVNVYLCLDYRTNKYDNGQLTFDGDGVYNDWVIKLTPADGSTVVVPDDNTPEEPNVTPDNPTKDETVKNDEVEINLSGEDKGDYLDSHLSIHVRSNTDVEVFIPVPARYYCDVDDMAIVEKHLDDFMVHGGPEKIEYTINDNVVTLTINFEPEGIRITTNGINENVIDYLYEKYNDGITFEIWNYFNETITKDELLTYLNQATVEFLNKRPDQYINSFGRDSDSDCTVSIIESQNGYYTPEYNQEHSCHSNGSCKNTVYSHN